MDLGHKRNHIDGELLNGSHTILIDGIDSVVKAMARKPWFESITTSYIRPESGGKPAVTIRRHHDEHRPHTLHFTFRRPGLIQGIDVNVHDIEDNIPKVVQDVKDIVRKKWRGGMVYDRTDEHAKEPEEAPKKEENSEALALLAKWGKRGSMRGNGRY